MEKKEDIDSSVHDDEVFFGRLTLKEVKKRIFMDVRENFLSRIASCDEKNRDRNDIKIIETSSQPNMLSAIDNEIPEEKFKSTSDPLFNRNKQYPNIQIAVNGEEQDSFLELEEKVTEQCQPPYNCDKNLDNTLEFVDFILHCAQSQQKNIPVANVIKHKTDCDMSGAKDDKVSKEEILPLTTHNDAKPYDNHVNGQNSICASNTPGKCDQTVTISRSNNLKPERANTLITPIRCKKPEFNLFKTPKNPQSAKKDVSEKKTPSRSKAYQHIASPIATYIRNSPQVPLVKNVQPKKPLPNTSLIPKFSRNVQEVKSDKENVLPQLAYRNAKKTLVIDVNKEKLPQSSWTQKLTKLPQNPVVLKHNHREAGKTPLSLQQQQEDSFQDLTLHQAEVSVCTQKLAFQKL